MPMKPIERALISVSDKTGLIPFAKALSEYKIEIISTGGTLEVLKKEGISAIPMDQFTGFPEMLDGRVKTLHPKVHGGLLFKRDQSFHVDQAKKHGIKPIDLVVVNLYPFEKVTQNPNIDLETAIENIDIGGPSMLRSAAKNQDFVTVLCDPADYETVLNEMKASKGAVSDALRKKLALKVFQRTSTYDHAIHQFFEKFDQAKPPEDHPHDPKKPLPERLDVVYVKSEDLRYGENPHQRAALYVRESGEPKFRFNQLHGKELSYNNYLDIEASIDVIREFERPVACVVKHNNPCGIAENEDLARALTLAIDCDPLSAFGGIVGLSRHCDEKTAKTLLEKLHFFEVVVAPTYDPAAVTALQQRKNLRIIATGEVGEGGPYDLRFLKSGVLLQDRDAPLRKHWQQLKKNLRTVTKAVPDEKTLEQLLFGFKCVKVVKSNAIVLTQNSETVGIGAGQMSRVDSVDIACRKAGSKTQGALLSSDAFFPMPDSIEMAHRYGIRAIIQPGGSIQDANVIAACDRLGIAMVMTGQRHFRH